MGIGTLVRLGGRACPDRTRPRGGRPRIARRRMQVDIILEEDMASLHREGLGGNARCAFLKKFDLPFHILPSHILIRFEDVI
jgi:hypothetical protein